MFSSQRGEAMQLTAVNATWIHLGLSKFYVQINDNFTNSSSVQTCHFYHSLQWHQKTIAELSCAIVCMILCYAIFIQYQHVTDRWTDIQTVDYSIYHTSILSHNNDHVFTAQKMIHIIAMAYSSSYNATVNAAQLSLNVRRNRHTLAIFSFITHHCCKRKLNALFQFTSSRLCILGHLTDDITKSSLLYCL